MPSRPATSGKALVATVVCGLLLAGCGEEERPSAAAPATKTTAAEPLGEKLGGSVAPLADCSDWNKGDRARKLATIADIRSQVSRRDTAVQAPPLTDDEAMRLFEGACAETYASSFRLYVLYARAAGFAALGRD